MPIIYHILYIDWTTANNIIDDNRNFIACAITHSFAIVLLNFIIYDLHLQMCSTYGMHWSTGMSTLRLHYQMTQTNGTHFYLLIRNLAQNIQFQCGAENSQANRCVSRIIRRKKNYAKSIMNEFTFWGHRKREIALSVCFSVGSWCWNCKIGAQLIAVYKLFAILQCCLCYLSNWNRCQRDFAVCIRQLQIVMNVKHFSSSSVVVNVNLLQWYVKKLRTPTGSYSCYLRRQFKEARVAGTAGCKNKMQRKMCAWSIFKLQIERAKWFIYYVYGRKIRELWT